MKKNILIPALAIAATLTAGAKTADELRVYINPGHGSWTPNDRPNPTVVHGQYTRTGTDTLGFFESNTNLQKGFGLMERLIDYGVKFDRTLNQTGELWQVGAARDMSNNIVFSHVKCGPYHDDNGTAKQLGSAAPKDLEYYNRDLSEISQEVIANNFDVFISIHSNALEDGLTTNYPLYLYRGYDTPKADTGLTTEIQEQSKKMAQMCWPYGIANTHSGWTAYANSQNIRGDINFYGSGSVSSITGYKGYLGALKHNTPGFLVEGYFHTYQPARHRALNHDVSRLEGVAYAHGLADYFGLTKEKTGTVYGIVRDLHEKFSHNYYKPNPATKDVYKPINGIKVILSKGNEKIAEYTTDGEYNGAYVFDGLEPGEYDITFESDTYKSGDPVIVTVKAADITYVQSQLEAKDYVAPKKEYVNYPDPAAKIAGVAAADEYAFAATYTDEPVAELEGKIIRRAIAREGLIYILAVDKEITYAANIAPEDQAQPTIIVYNPAIKRTVATVSTAACAGSVAPVGDIQVTAEGYLLATNLTKNQYADAQIQDGDAGRGTLFVYRWDNDENGLPAGEAKQWLKTQNAGRWYRSYAGNTFAWSGTIEDGQVLLAQPTITAPNHNLRSTMITVANGMQVATGDILYPNTDSRAWGEVDFGPGFRYITSPLDKTKVMGVGPKAVLDFDFAHADNGTDNAKGNEQTVNPGTVGFFKYAGQSYMAAPSYDGEAINGVTLTLVSNGVDKATPVSTINTTVAAVTPAALGTEGAAAGNAAVMGEVEAVYDEITELPVQAFINLYLIRDGKITKFTTRNVKQPVQRKEMAYGLNAVKEGTDHIITYSITGDAVGADLILTPAEGESVRIAVPAAAGANTYTLPASEIAEGTYTWAIEVRSKANANAGEYASDNHGLSDTRGGVVTITDPTAASYGYTVVAHGKMQGIDIYDPAGNKVGQRVWKNHSTFGKTGNTNQSDPFRGHEREGKAVLAGWGDSSAGLIVVDPLQNEEPYGLYAGTKQSAGHWMYNGVNLGGGVAGHCFVGKGENTRLYTFSEDHEGLNGSGATENSVVRYDLGNAWQITAAPVVIGHKATMANTNVDMLGYGNGFFMSQVRGAGNNATGCPGFVYISADTEDQTFNSGTIEGMTECNAGIAISPDGKTLAVGESSRIAIYDVTWKSDDTPAVAFKYAIPTSKTVGWSHMRFDAAGNLHTYERENGGYHSYAMQDLNPVVTTPAQPANIIAVGDDVRDITVEATGANPVYYNLNGVRVDAADLRPGVYVKVAGNTTAKVVVK